MCSLSSLKPDRDWSVVIDFHQHMHTELTCLGRDAMAAQEFSKSIHQWCGHFRGACIDKRGTASLARICVKRELRHEDGFAVHILKRQIRLSIFVFKDSQIGNFFGQIGCLLFPIFLDRKSVV